MPFLRLPHEFDLLSLVQRQPARYPYLLESVARGTAQARYDVLFAFPGITFIADAKTDFLQRLDEQWQAQAHYAPHLPAGLPFRGGWFVYLGYELAQQIETVLHLTPDTDLPAAFATRIPAAVIRDHQAHCTWLVAEQEQQLQALQADCIDCAEEKEADEKPWPACRLSEDPPQAFLEGVERVKRYIYEGDVFQVNLSRAWQGEFAAALSPVQFYRRLRHTNPGPFAGLVHYQGQAIISSSPERLVNMNDGLISARPIAGTFPRGQNKNEDRRLAEHLLQHPKERAEHIMLIDLIRNDLGRLARPGSVRVSELMSLERYRHVHHIVSNVQGRAPLDYSPGRLLRAVFPGGTITGCPKIRCMEIIAELEGVARGPYTGSMGYLNHDGSLDFNILIRTLHMRERRIRLRAGAGIVADSDAARELQETRNKARGLLLAFETP